MTSGEKGLPVGVNSVFIQWVYGDVDVWLIGAAISLLAVSGQVVFLYTYPSVVNHRGIVDE